MYPILPAIIPHSVDDLLVLPTQLRFAPCIQIDIVDGVFAEPASWPYQPAGELADIASVFEHFQVQVDIMALDTVAVATAWAAAGAHELVVHIESVATLDDILALKQVYGTAIWIAVNDDTPLERIYPYLPEVSGVQLMGIHTIGKQGQPLSDRVLENIRTVRAQYPTLPIQIDGSVNADTVCILRDAGATQFVVGSGIMGAEDSRAAYQALRALVEGV